MKEELGDAEGSILTRRTIDFTRIFFSSMSCSFRELSMPYLFDIYFSIVTKISNFLKK